MITAGGLHTLTWQLSLPYEQANQAYWTQICLNDTESPRRALFFYWLWNKFTRVRPFRGETGKFIPEPVEKQGERQVIFAKQKKRNIALGR